MPESYRQHQMPTALIAAGEPFAAHGMRAILAREWPELDVVTVVGNGRQAVGESLRLLPDILFTDTRMPVLDGIAAAERLAERWPQEWQAPPELIFVTSAEDPVSHSLMKAGIDHLLKPLERSRLRRVVDRLQFALNRRASTRFTFPGRTPDDSVEGTWAHWRHILETAAQMGTAAPLQFLHIPDAPGYGLGVVPIDEVVYFEAADREVRVVTNNTDHIIPTSLRQLQERLDPAMFSRIHHSVIVRTSRIARSSTDESGRLQLHLHDRPERLTVGRLYAPRWRPASPCHPMGLRL